MFRKWLEENNIKEFDYSGIIFEKASNRDFWESKFNKAYIENAEQFLGFEWPLIRATDYIAFKAEGNRIKQETPHLKKRSALIALLIGEIIEYKGRFIPDIVDGVYNICEESFWGVSAHYRHDSHPKLPCGEHYIDLFAAETGALIAIVLHILRDELNNYWPEIVERMEYNLNERMVKPYIKYDNFPWMGTYNKVNNWNPWIISNILTVFLLSQQGKPMFYEGIEKMIYQINNIYKEYHNDGGCDEGITYWSLSGGTIFEFCEQLYLATNGKINFFNDEKIKNIGDYPYKAYIGNNYFVNFADGSCKGLPVFKSIYNGFGKRIGNKNLCELAKEDFDVQRDTLWSMRTTYTKRALNNMIYNKLLNSKSELKLCEAAVLPDIQNAFAREDKWYYAAKGGHNNENHNHNDVGSFMVYYDCNPVLIDPGCGDYTKKTFSPQRYEIWTMRSEWHNTPVINGKQQLAGREYCAESFSYENKKCAVSFAKAYEDGSGLNELTREISINENGIEIEDLFKFESNNNTVAEHFITPLEVEIKENSVIIGGEFLLSADCEMEISVQNQKISGDEKLTLAWNKEALNRIIFKNTVSDNKSIKFSLKKIV